MAQAYGVWVNIGHGGGVNVRANKVGSISAACVWQPLAHGWFKLNTDAAVDVKFCKLGYAAVVLIMMVGHCYVALTMVSTQMMLTKLRRKPYTLIRGLLVRLIYLF